MMPFYFMFSNTQSQRQNERMWLISGSDIKTTKRDVMPFVKNMKKLIFWIEVHASEMDLVT